MGLEEEVIFLMSMVAMELASSKPTESWASSFKVYTACQLALHQTGGDPGFPECVLVCDPPLSRLENGKALEGLLLPGRLSRAALPLSVPPRHLWPRPTAVNVASVAPQHATLASVSKSGSVRPWPPGFNHRRTPRNTAYNASAAVPVRYRQAIWREKHGVDRFCSEDAPGWDSSSLAEQTSSHF